MQRTLKLDDDKMGHFNLVNAQIQQVQPLVPHMHPPANPSVGQSVIQSLSQASKQGGNQASNKFCVLTLTTEVNRP